MKMDRKIFLFAIALGLLVGVVDTFLDYLFFYPGKSLLGLLVFDVPQHEIYIRTVILICFILFGFVSSRIIAQRKEAEKELLTAKATLENIFNNAIPLCITSKDFEILQSNDSYKAAFGTKPAEFNNPIKCYDSREGETCNSPECPLNLILQGKEEVSCEATKEDSDGIPKTYLVTARPFLDAKQEVVGIVESFQDITDLKRVETVKSELIDELQNALDDVKKLSGLLPICASCKKIRDDQGYWNQIEVYIRDHSEAEFSHSICGECSDKLYGTHDWYKKNRK